MFTHTVFTTITPLPPGLSRDAAVALLHDHGQMMDLNPLVVARRPTTPPAYAPLEERAYTWYALVDRVSWLAPRVSYVCAFRDLPRGLQTHCYAPLGVDIHDRWSVAGALPGEPPEDDDEDGGARDAPEVGLYLREQVDLRCCFLMAAYVKKTLKKAHAALVQRLAAMGEDGVLKPIATSRQEQEQGQSSARRPGRHEPAAGL